MGPTLSSTVILLRPTALAVDAESLGDEARIVSRFQHPNIVTLYEIGHHHGLPYFVSEYVAGESLRDRLDNAGPLPVASAVILMSQIAGGIAYAHERGIGHYDLNPANVLVAGEHTPKVMDFGLSGQAAPSDGAIRGTLRYMSPQRLEGAPAALGCDVFALGAMFFELLTGRSRFDAAEPNEIMMQIFRTSPDEIEDLLPEVPSVGSQGIVLLVRPVAESKRDPAGHGQRLLGFGEAPGEHYREGRCAHTARARHRQFRPLYGSPGHHDQPCGRDARPRSGSTVHDQRVG